VRLCPLGCWQRLRFRCRAPDLACRDLAESYDDGSVIRCQERLGSLEELFCSFCREYHKFETTRNFRKTIFDSNSGHGEYVISPDRDKQEIGASAALNAREETFHIFEYLAPTRTRNGPPKPVMPARSFTRLHDAGSSM
jgi:hypothetical protein